MDNELAEGKELDRQMKLLLRLASDLPREQCQAGIAEYEHFVQQGAYNRLLRDNAKYILRVKGLQESAEFHNDLAELKSAFDLSLYRTKDAKEILRPHPRQRTQHPRQFQIPLGH